MGSSPLTDRDLVRLYWPVDLRSAFDALFAIDDALADVVATSTELALGAVRLAWWREALERLDSDPAPPEPRLQAAAAELLPRGVTGASLAGLEDGWATLLDERRDPKRIAERGARLFAVAARLIGATDPMLADAGRLYARGQAARLSLMTDRLGNGQLSRHRFPARLRPLTGLAALAARDLKRAPVIEQEATPGRAFALLRHRLTGRIPIGD